MDDLTEVVKTEGKKVMNQVGMKVLNNFWRHFTTADAETQTYDKAIDTLKEVVEGLKKKNTDYRN